MRTEQDTTETLLELGLNSSRAHLSQQSGIRATQNQCLREDMIMETLERRHPYGQVHDSGFEMIDLNGYVAERTILAQVIHRAPQEPPLLVNTWRFGPESRVFVAKHAVEGVRQ